MSQTRTRRTLYREPATKAPVVSKTLPYFNETHLVNGGWPQIRTKVGSQTETGKSFSSLTMSWMKSTVRDLQPVDTPSRTSGTSALLRTLNKPACSAVLVTVSTTTSLSLTALHTKATTVLAYGSWMSGACPGIQLVPASGRSGFSTFTPRTILSQTVDLSSLSGAGVTTPSSRADTFWSTPLSVVPLLSNGPTRGWSWMVISCRRVYPDMSRVELLNTPISHQPGRIVAL